jgi:hypothetical protein
MNRGYWPAQAYTGGPNDTIFRGRNVIFQGGPETVYAEVHPGHELIYTIPETSTVSSSPLTCTQGSTLVTSNALNQFLILPGFILNIGRRLYVITAVESAGDPIGGDCQFRISPPFQDTSGNYPLFNIPWLVQTTNQVLALMRGGGSIQAVPKGHFLVTGASMFFLPESTAVRILPGKYGGGLTVGDFRIQGQNPGLLSFMPKEGVYPSSGITAFVVGFDAPIITNLVETSYLGVKNMPPGTYSLRIARGREETGGYGVLSEAKEVEITIEGRKMQLTFPAADNLGPGNLRQTSWQVFGSLFSVAEGVTGPWYQITEISEEEVAAAGRIVDFEYRDYEIAGRTLASFDNDPPPRASFLSIFGGIPLLIGAYGTKPTSFGPATVPFGREYPGGPVLQPGKYINPEGFPPNAGVPIGQPEPIVGYVEAEGRVYIMSKNALHVAVLTGNDQAPVTVRPFSQSAFARQGNLLYVEGTLYGFTRNGPVRFSTEGDTGAEDKAFAAIVATDMVDWEAERVCIGYDPASQSVVYFHANDYLNPATAKWESVAIAYHTKLGVWSTPIDIRSATEDMHVTSCCTLAGRLHFTTNSLIFEPGPLADKIWVWGMGSAPVEWYVLTPYVDQGAEGWDKSLRGMAATYFVTNNATASIFAAQSDEQVDIASAILQSNATAASGSESLAISMTKPTSAVKTSQYIKINIARKRLYAVRFGSIYTPGAMADRVDEIVIEGFTHIPRH